jgi:hypothetical protein
MANFDEWWRRRCDGGRKFRRQRGERAVVMVYEMVDSGGR